MDKKSLLMAVKSAMVNAPETAYSPEQHATMAKCHATVKRINAMRHEIQKHHSVDRTNAVVELEETRKAATFLEFQGEGRCTYRVANGKSELKAFADKLEKWTGITTTKPKAKAGTTCPPPFPAVAMAKPTAFPATCKAGIDALQKSGICHTDAGRMSISTPWRIEGYPTSDYAGWLTATDSRRAILLNCGEDMSGVKPVLDKDGTPLARPNALQVIPDYSQLAGIPVMVAPTITTLALATTVSVSKNDYASVRVYETETGINFSASSMETGEFFDTDTVGARFLFLCNPYFLHDALALAAKVGISALTLTHADSLSLFTLSADRFLYLQMPVRT